MAKRKQPIKKIVKPKDLLRGKLEAFATLLKNNHFEVGYYTSSFYNNGYWEFEKGSIKGKMFYDKLFPCDSRIVADSKSISLSRHSKVFTTVPNNTDQRTQLLAALYDLQYKDDFKEFKEYTKIEKIDITATPKGSAKFINDNKK